jgi:Leucine-rich repeat (LRR) protein
MANLSISSFPSDLPCTSSEHIYFSGKVSRSYRNKTGVWAAPHDESSAARHEQFSAIDYEYKPPSVEELSEDDVLPSDDSIEEVSRTSILPVGEGTVIVHTPHHNKDLRFDPLSSFATHQIDNKADRSYIDHNAYPTTVRQVYGSLSLHNEKLIKAITDATGGELNWDKIKALDISRKGLTSLHGLEKYCPSLSILNIDNNSIENLDGCPSKLRILSANKNRLSSLTSWGHLPHLCRVNATDNKLEHLDGMAELLHLTELDVSRNHIKNVQGLGFLAELRKLNLSDNFIERIKWRGWFWKSLIELDMSYNMVYTVDSLDALPRLEILNLEKNVINSFSDDGKRVHKCLRGLNLKRNNVMSFDFMYFPALQVLNLDENIIMSAASLRELPKARSLIKLSLRYQQDSVQGHENKLLDTMMNTRGHFQELYLSRNPTTGNQGLVAMPLNFKHCNIRVLEMAACGITRLPDRFGQYFPTCHTMNLNFNAIDDIAELRGLEAMEKLLLARNRLNKPKSVANLRLPELRILDLRDNRFNTHWYNTMPGEDAEPSRDYPPGTETPGPFELPGRVDDIKSDWFQTLPEYVQVKRLFINMILAMSCPELTEFDGASWDGKPFLASKNVILRTMGEYGMISGRQASGRQVS